MKNKIIGINEPNIFDGFSAIFKDQSTTPSVVVNAIRNNPNHTKLIVSTASGLATQHILAIVREAVIAFPEKTGDIVFGAVSVGMFIDETFHLQIVTAATESSIDHFGEIVAAANEARGLTRN